MKSSRVCDNDNDDNDQLPLGTFERCISYENQQQIGNQGGKKCLQLCVHHIRGFKGSIFRACGKRQHFFVTKTCRCSSIYSFRMQYSKHKIQASFFSRRITRRPKPNSPAYTGSKPGFRLETPARKGYPGLGPATGPKNGHKPS